MNVAQIDAGDQVTLDDLSGIEMEERPGSGTAGDVLVAALRRVRESGGSIVTLAKTSEPQLPAAAPSSYDISSPRSPREKIRDPPTSQKVRICAL